MFLSRTFVAIALCSFTAQFSSSGLHCFILHCTKWYKVTREMYYIVVHMHCIALAPHSNKSNELHLDIVALHCIILHWITLQYIGVHMHCIELQYIGVQVHCIALAQWHSDKIIAIYCKTNALHCIGAAAQ